MKKDYDYYVSRRNTPNLELNTWLIGLFGGFSGFDAILPAIVCWEDNRDQSFSSCLLGVALCLNVPRAVSDLRRENRNFLSVVIDGLHIF